MRASGAKTSVKFAQEVVWKHPFDATHPLGNVYGLNIRSCSLGGTKNQFQSETINDKRTVVGLGEGNKAVEGDIVTDFLPEGQEVLFHHLLGKNGDGNISRTTGIDHTDSSDTSNYEPALGDESSKKVLTLKGRADTLEGLCIQKEFTSLGQRFVYRGCRVNSMTLNIIQEGFHDITWNFIGTGEEVNTSDEFAGKTASYSFKDGYTGYQAKVYIKRPARIAQDGTTQIAADEHWVLLGNITNGNITITNNVETDGYVIGSDERASAEYGTRQCTGSWTMFFEDVDLYRIYQKGLECSLMFVFENPNEEKIRFTFPSVKLGGDSPTIDSPSGINLNLTFQAKYFDDDTSDEQDGTDVIVEFVNTTETALEGQPTEVAGS